jgi:hypothetical protein
MLWSFNSDSSLKQQSAGKHVAPLGHIILNLSQPVIALAPRSKYQFYKSLVWPNHCSNPRSTVLDEWPHEPSNENDDRETMEVLITKLLYML